MGEGGECSMARGRGGARVPVNHSLHTTTVSGRRGEGPPRGWQLLPCLVAAGEEPGCCGALMEASRPSFDLCEC